MRVDRAEQRPVMDRTEHILVQVRSAVEAHRQAIDTDTNLQALTIEVRFRAGTGAVRAVIVTARSEHEEP